MWVLLLVEGPQFPPQMQRALLELKAAETATDQLSEKVAALDAVLNAHRPPAGGAAAAVTMLHQAHTRE